MWKLEKFYKILDVNKEQEGELEEVWAGRRVWEGKDSVKVLDALGIFSIPGARSYRGVNRAGSRLKTPIVKPGLAKGCTVS